MRSTWIIGFPKLLEVLKHTSGSNARWIWRRITTSERAFNRCRNLPYYHELLMNMPHNRFEHLLKYGTMEVDN